MTGPGIPDVALPGGVDAVRETHGSWVFLGDGVALKVKKPVRLAFLDYGSLERRREACRAEVALNRALAPDVYRGVRALRPGPGGRLVPVGEDDPRAVEYAVEMRRFDDAATLEARAAYEVPEVLAALGARLARFHAGAPPRPEAAPAGGKRALDDTLTSLLEHAEGEDRAAVARAARFAAVAVARRWEQLTQRAACGRVREVHGDLRAEHVVLEPDGVRIVDRIEFDPALRAIDVASDLAFLVMDLHRLERPDLAQALAAGYRAAGGDPGDDGLVAHFAVYRALVRAKVALVRGAQERAGAGPEVPGGACAAEAHGFLRLAERFAWRSRGRVVVLVAGVSGAGKTTLAAELARRSGLPHVSSDRVRKAALGLGAAEPAPAAAYSRARDAATYGTLVREAAAAPDGAIADATFGRPEQRAHALEALGAAGAVLLVVECVAPAGTLRERVRERRVATPASRGGSDADERVLEAQLARRTPFTDVPARAHVVVRTDQPVEAVADAVTDALDGRLPPVTAP